MLFIKPLVTVGQTRARAPCPAARRLLSVIHDGQTASRVTPSIGIQA